MPPLLGFLAAGLVASMAVLFARERRRERIKVWHEAARAAGLEGVSTRTDLFETRLQGRAGDLPVSLESYRSGRYERGTRIRVRCSPAGAAGLSVRREGVGTTLGKLAGAQEIELGDPRFDRECFVQGALPLALAVLDRPTRRTLAGLLGGYLPVGGTEIAVRTLLEDGMLSVDLRDFPFQKPGGRVGAVLPAVLELARRLLPPPDLAVRLAENLRTEPEAGVRVQIVRTLAREFRAHPATRPALLAACVDRGDEVRLRAAMALGEEGRETLLALVAKDAADDDCRAQAVNALGTALDPVQLEAALRQARASRRLLTTCACLDALAGSAATAREALLVDALSDEAAAVRLAAARGLARSGTAAAVAPLLEVESAGGELRSAARQAIAEIQARLKGAAPGQLSLAAGEAGTLSLADGEAGQLSVVPDEQHPPASAEEDRNPPPARPRTGVEQ